MYARILLVLPLAIAVTPAIGQVPGRPNFGSTDFQTYTDMLDKIIDPSSGTTGCPGLGAFGQTPSSDPEYEFFSRALQVLCTPPFNGNSGATLSGAFGDPFSSRTFLPFIVDTLRPVEEEEGTSSTESAITVPDGAMSFLQSHRSGTAKLTFGLDVARSARDDTLHEAGQDGKSYRLASTLSWANDRGGHSGVQLLLQHQDFTSTKLPPLDQSVRSPGSGRPIAEIEEMLEKAAEFCDGGSPGSADEKGFGASAFRSAKISGGVGLFLNAGIYRTQNSYEFPVCMFRLAQSSGDGLFAGRLNGKPVTHDLFLTARLDKTIMTENGWLVPRASVTVRRVHRSGFTEGETTFSPDTGFEFGERRFLEALPTGIALSYDSKVTTQVTSELGVTAIWPFSMRQGHGTIWVDAAYHHRFGDPDRRLSARFAGDGREIPTRVSFLGNPVDTSVFTLGLGADLQMRKNAVLSLRTSVLLGDDINRSASIGAFYSWKF